LIYEATGQLGLKASLGSFHWLGSFIQSNNVTVAWAASGIRSLHDAINHEVKTGAVGAASAVVLATPQPVRHRIQSVLGLPLN
jgi:hypothetical protein